MAEKCVLCAARRPKRYCPALRGDICPQCCGKEREETIACPFDCEYLRQGRDHERLRELAPEEIPHREIVIQEQFLKDHEPLVLVAAAAIAEGSERLEGLIDADAREALESLVQTYKTLGSGLIYESKPRNPIAAALHELVQLRVGEFRQRIMEQAGYAGILDSHVLGVLLFLQRLELQLNNGRRRGRSFLDAVRQFLPPPQPANPATMGVWQPE
jgi:hypothetical protein